VRLNEPKLAPLRTGGVLVVGDSLTAGPKVLDSQTWSAQLEAMTGKPVINAAVGAYGVDQMVLRAESLLDEVRPTTLIVGILSQASLRNSFTLFGGGHKPYFVNQNGEAVLKGVPVPSIDDRPPRLGLMRNVLGHFYIVAAAFDHLGMHDWWINGRYGYVQSYSNEDGVVISCLLMERLAALRDTRKLRIIVLMLYGAAEVEQKPAPWFATSVIGCARQDGLETLDTYPAYRAVLERDRAAFVELWIDEGGVLGHFTPKGHAFIAALLHDAFFAH